MYLLKISNVLKEARSEEAFVRNRRRASRSRSPFLSSQSAAFGPVSVVALRTFGL